MRTFEKSRFLTAFILAGFVSLTHKGALAENEGASKVLSVESLRAYAFSKSPLIAKIDASFVDQLGVAIETGQLQNPEIQVQAQHASSYSGERPEDRYAVTISQPLRLSDFGARSAVENLLRKAATQKQQVELLELSQNILLQYVNLWALKSRKSFVEEMRSLASRKASLAAEGKHRGFLGTSEVKLLQGAAARLKLLELGLGADISSTEATLTNLTGFAFLDYEVEQPEFIEIPSLEEAVKKSHESSLGIGSRVDLLEDVARRQAQLAKTDSFPGFSPSLLYEHEDGSDFIGIGVSFELPIFNGNQGEVVRKKGSERELSASQEYIERGAFRSELKATLKGVQLKFDQAKA
ncbi:MAG: hypothetical protein KDD42_08950, partial [Bdellovibrionales bacterium]|nr:hypothetical protein [Bdellovibrionales bacterium]